MEELIKEYIEKTYDYTIDNLMIEIDGSICLAKYTICEYAHESEQKKKNKHLGYGVIFKRTEVISQ